MGLLISPRVREKLAQKTQPVSDAEILQCFANRTGKYLFDTREQHKTDPPTRWFIAETDFGRRLKVVFVPKGADMVNKTTYDPNQAELNIYQT